MVIAALNIIKGMMCTCQHSPHVLKAYLSTFSVYLCKSLDDWLNLQHSLFHHQWLVCLCHSYPLLAYLSHYHSQCQLLSSWPLIAMQILTGHKHSVLSISLSFNTTNTITQAAHKMCIYSYIEYYKIILI